MKRPILAAVILVTFPAFAFGADTASKAPANPARSAVVRRERPSIGKRTRSATAPWRPRNEAAAKCQESGKDEDFCMAALAKACKGIAYGKYCGMKHPD
jgi:hypothetical protein